METLRLLKIQQPSGIERLLEAFVSRAWGLPEGAYRILDRRALPSELQGVLTQAIAQGQVWSCWAHGASLWLFTAEMSLPLSRERGAPVLRINQYDDHGALQDSGGWIGTQDGWQRCVD